MAPKASKTISAHLAASAGSASRKVTLSADAIAIPTLHTGAVRGEPTATIRPGQAALGCSALRQRIAEHGACRHGRVHGSRPRSVTRGIGCAAEAMASWPYAISLVGIANRAKGRAR